MIRLSVLFAFVAGALAWGPGSIAAQNTDPKWSAMTIQAATEDHDFALQGEYTGTGTGVQVVAEGQGKFRVVKYQGGLPGAGWDHSPAQVVEGEEAASVRAIIAQQQLKRIERKSPTLGAKPPEGAIVLIDGTQQTLQKHWRDGARLDDDGLLMQGATTKETFRDFTLHLAQSEFEEVVQKLRDAGFLSGDFATCRVF